jgi:hypothetical protein
VIPGGKPAVVRYQLLTDKEIGRLTDPSRIVEEVGPIEANPELTPPPLDPDGAGGPANDPAMFDSAPNVRAKPIKGGDSEPIDWSGAPRVRARRPGDAPPAGPAGQ